jgi:hypothetical protein
MLSEAEVFNATHTVHLQDENYQIEDTGGSVTSEYGRK